MNLLDELKLAAQNPGATTGAKFWSKTTQQGEITSYNPSTGKPIAKVFQSSAQDYEQVIDAAEQAFLTWRTMPAPKRGNIVREIGELIRHNKSALGSLMALEMGKSKQEGDGEVQEMIDMAELAVGMSRQLYGKTMHSERPQHRMYEQWHPLGPVGVITAFNFPVAVWAWNAFVAAVCGDTIVWKPSPKTPLCAIAIQHLCQQVMQQNNLNGIFNLFITDDLSLSKNMVNDKRLPLISFTGSSKVGCEVQQMVAQRMGRTLLECSGNNAIIVDESADLKLALPSIVFGAVGTAGQRCTTTRRLFIHEHLYDKLLENLIAAYHNITIGDPLDQKNLMGPLIDQSAVENFLTAVKDAQTAGGKILAGGNKIDRPGFFVEPTLVQAKADWPVVQRETFAPILYVMPYKKLPDAIAMQNNVCQGLSSSMFTSNIKHAELFLSHCGSDCGIANINIGTSGAEIGGAFGGEKETGGGREAGSDAWKAYMRRQTNTINWSDELPLAQGIQFNVS